jgi:hypothetical protein
MPPSTLCSPFVESAAGEQPLITLPGLHQLAVLRNLG